MPPAIRFGKCYGGPDFRGHLLPQTAVYRLMRHMDFEDHNLRKLCDIVQSIADNFLEDAGFFNRVLIKLRSISIAFSGVDP